MDFRKLLWPHRRWEAACLAVLGVAFFIRFPLKDLLSHPFLMDFNVYHFAAQLVTNGQGAQLYDLGYSEGMYFRYAPIWAILWSPLAWLSLHHAGVLWGSLSVGWLTLTLWVSARIVEQLGLRAPWWAGVAVTLLLVRQLISEFSMGQADLWSGGLVVLFLWCALRQRLWLASLSLALATILKLPALLLLAYLVCTRRWSLALRTLAGMSLLILLGAVLLEPRNPGHLLMRWALSLAETSSKQAFMIGDQSLRALLGRLLTADGYGLNLMSLSRATIVTLALVTEAALFLLLVWPGTDRRQPLRFTFDIAMLMVLMVLASPAAWLATYTILLFPMFLGLAALVSSVAAKRLDRWSVLLTALTGLISLLTNSKLWKAFGIRAWKTETYVYLVFMIPPLAGLSLFGLLAWQRWMWQVRIRDAASSPDTSRS